MKKFLGILLALTMLLSLGATSLADDASAIAAKDMTWYLCSADEVRTQPVYFVGDSDVPYISLEDWAELYPYLLRNNTYKNQHISFDLAFSRDGETGTLTRTDGAPYTMVVDCAADTITFYDYDAFLRPEEDRVLLDVLTADSPHSDDDMQLFRRTEGSYERYGDQVVLDCGAYGIDLAADENGVYVPMQTISDFLLSLKYINLYYNGEVIIFAEFGKLEDAQTQELTALGELFYSTGERELSEAMGRFNYAELCLVFDNLYGLKDVHGIESFEELTLQTGTRGALMGTDPNAADAALFGILWVHLDDQHSGFNKASPWCRDGLFMEMVTEKGIGRSTLASLSEMERYGAARATAFPDGVPAYQEVGNTAYITFDKFASIPEGVNYYETAPTADNTDTIGIIIYAYSRIMREDSPIENVVLDLSNNDGGDADTAIFVLSAFLGEGYGSLKNTMTGALATGVYNVDVNLDGKFDENDRGLLGKKLFCLTSLNSFSCGNFVPSVFKNSNIVTLIGKTSGGGSCVVLPLTTAYGSIFQISGPHRLAFTKNGSFYDIDQGAEPDYTLSFPESFYDREALTEYINGIR